MYWYEGRTLCPFRACLITPQACIILHFGYVRVLVSKNGPHVRFHIGYDVNVKHRVCALYHSLRAKQPPTDAEEHPVRVDRLQLAGRRHQMNRPSFQS